MKRIRWSLKPPSTRLSTPIPWTLVELIMALEEEFSTDDLEVAIADEDAEKIVTVQNAVDYLKEHGVEDD